MDASPAPGSAPGRRPAAEVEPLWYPSSLRVLLVEDEADHAELVAVYLAEADDLDVALDHAPTVGQAAEMLSAARAGRRAYDAVLCDQRLPDSEYWESVERVVAAAGSTPVIALTSIGDTDVALDAMRQGAQDYLVKSELSAELLRRTLRYALERARHTAELRAANEGLEARVREQTAHVRSLSAQLAVAEQEERRRIAQLLHDDLQQRLHGLSITLSLLARAASEAEREALAARADRTLAEATALTRTLATDLNPGALGAGRLEVALRWLAERNREDLGLEVDVDGEVHVPDPTLRALLFHLVRELLFNVAKHAGTPRARVALGEADGRVTVCVRDEGAGFDVSALGGRAGGLGLASIRERLAVVGGTIDVDSAPGAGTRVTLTVPVETSLGVPLGAPAGVPAAD